MCESRSISERIEESTSDLLEKSKGEKNVTCGDVQVGTKVNHYYSTRVQRAYLANISEVAVCGMSGD